MNKTTISGGERRPINHYSAAAHILGDTSGIAKIQLVRHRFRSARRAARDHSEA